MCDNIPGFKAFLKKVWETIALIYMMIKIVSSISKQNFVRKFGALELRKVITFQNGFSHNKRSNKVIRNIYAH